MWLPRTVELVVSIVLPGLDLDWILFYFFQIFLQPLSEFFAGLTMQAELAIQANQFGPGEILQNRVGVVV